MGTGRYYCCLDRRFILLGSVGIFPLVSCWWRFYRRRFRKRGSSGLTLSLLIRPLAATFLKHRYDGYVQNLFFRSMCLFFGSVLLILGLDYNKTTFDRFGGERDLWSPIILLVRIFPFFLFRFSPDLRQQRSKTFLIILTYCSLGSISDGNDFSSSPPGFCESCTCSAE